MNPPFEPRTANRNSPSSIHPTMPYDPTLPLPNSPLQSQVIRDQLQALFNLINNIVTVASAQVDGTNTLPQGSPATASVTVVGNTLHFTFAIPQGQEGLVGPAGPPFADAVVDGVTTLNPGDAATVGVSFDGMNVRFTFGIPRGSDGSNGTDGTNGSNGSPGEVSNAQLDSAINGTSNNSNSVSALGLGVSDPPTQAEMQSMANKLDELINALKR
jgi:hypothetical protein